jgi:hypothetical protein
MGGALRIGPVARTALKVPGRMAAGWKRLLHRVGGL